MTWDPPELPAAPSLVVSWKVGERWQVVFDPSCWQRVRGGWPSSWRAQGWAEPIFYGWALGPFELRRFRG